MATEDKFCWASHRLWSEVSEAQRPCWRDFLFQKPEYLAEEASRTQIMNWVSGKG